MALFKPYKITSDKLEDLAIKEGQLIVTTDTKKLYVDVSATERIEVTADAEVDLSDYVTKEDADAAYAAIAHTHDDRYYTESEVDSKLADKANTTHTHTIGDVSNLQETIEGLEEDIAGKANVSHTHDDRYFTESEVTDKLATKADTGHKHAASDITSGTFALDRIPTITDAKISGMSASKLTGTIPTANLPSYVDDVVEGATTEDFPETGEAGKIYVATSTNKTYRWGGSSYVEISASLALGTTSSTAFRGDYGNVAYTHATAKGAAFGSGLYKITTNAQGHVTAATAVTKADITALGIPGSDTNTNTTYTLSKSGSTIMLSGSDGSSTSVTDANTTYSLGSFGITATAAELNKLDGVTATATELNYVDGVTSNIQTQLNGKAASSHTHSNATTSAAGFLPKLGGGTTNYLRADGTWAKPPDTNTTYSNMSGATTSAAGKAGLVPAPAAGAATRYLRSDGTWQVPPDTNTTYSAATTSSAGLMSAADKTKLDGIASGANKYTLPVATASALGGVRIGFPESGKNYPVELNSSNQMFVNVPWTDTNTTYTLSSFGITATAAELNKLDGVTATATELNYVDGVTSNIQTQLNGKAATSHTHSYLPLSGGTLTGTLNSRAIAPTATNTYSLGTSSLKYKAVYATTFYGSLSGNASSATKLGSSTIGSGVKPIYLNEGAAVASSSTVGSATRPVYLSNGAITQGTYTLGAACAKGVDTSISTGSTSTNLPTSKAVAALVASSGGGQEIAIQSTEPTDSNIKLWIKI